MSAASPYYSDSNCLRLAQFDRLSRIEQISAVVGMAGDGYSDHEIAGVTRLSVDMIRQIIGGRLNISNAPPSSET